MFFVLLNLMKRCSVQILWSSLDASDPGALVVFLPISLFIQNRFKTWTSVLSVLVFVSVQELQYQILFLSTNCRRRPRAAAANSWIGNS